MQKIKNKFSIYTGRRHLPFVFLISTDSFDSKFETFTFNESFELLIMVLSRFIKSKKVFNVEN